MSDQEQSVLDVVEESSPSSESPSSEKGPNDNSELSSSPQSKPEAPFHEHPRFKELVQQKNEFAAKIQDYERRFQEIQGKFDSKPKETVESSEAKLISRLKGIDPEFGTWAEQQQKLQTELSELKQWRQQNEHNTYITSAKSVAEKLQGELKVDPELHNLYLSQIPMGTPVEKIGEMYKSINDKVSKLFEAKERAVLSKYTEGKKSDAKVPAPAKGQPAKPSKASDKAAYSKDPAEARAQIVQNTLRMMRNQ